MKSENLSFRSPLEKEAWESFEVGSFDDVWDLAVKNPDQVFLQHLAYLASAEMEKEYPHHFQNQNPSYCLY